jgi:hypothetical protein
MRQVYPADMVAHLWAHKSQESARESGRQFYFEGDTIYSYGSHFPIARHITHKGKCAVLFTKRGYSVTTEKHKNVVGRACRHLVVFHVDDVDGEDRRAQFAEYQRDYTDRARKYVKARRHKPHYLAALRALVDEANAFASFFGLRHRLTLADEANLQRECAAIEKRVKAQAVRENKRREAEQRKREAEREERRAAWLAGASDYYPNGGPIRLRINGDELQTSEGAAVPLDHAIKAYRILQRLRAAGQSYQRNGHTIHLGPFALDAMDNDGTVRAGCHRVEWAEVERVAVLAGVH